MTVENWSEEQDAWLERQCRTTRLSYAELAKEFNAAFGSERSRFSVLSRASRTGYAKLKPAPIVTRAEPAPRPRKRAMEKPEPVLVTDTKTGRGGRLAG